MTRDAPSDCAAPPTPRTHSPSPWLVVIDMQTAFADPSSDWAIPEYSEIEPIISDLAKRYREQVVHTRFVPDPAEPGAWTHYYDQWASMRRPPSSPIWDLTKPPPADIPVVSLPTFSKWGPALDEVTGDSAPLHLCGAATDCCVLATALAAADAGREVFVITDACRGISAQHHHEALSLLNLLTPLVQLTTSRTVANPAG